MPDGAAFDGTPARADTIIDGLLAIEPDGPPYLLTKASLHRLRGFRLFDSGYASAFAFDRGFLLAERGEFQEAMRELDRSGVPLSAWKVIREKPTDHSGYFTVVQWTNYVERSLVSVEVLAGLGRFEEAISILKNCSDMIDWCIQQQPQVARYYDFQDVVYWKLGLIAFLNGNAELARSHFRDSFSDRRPLRVTGPPRDPRRTQRAFRLVACPIGELRDPESAMTIIDQAIDARTTDPRWWTTKALCHIRRAEWDQAEQSLRQADTHWRSPHALSAVVRLILAQARQLPESDTSPTPVHQHHPQPRPDCGGRRERA